MTEETFPTIHSRSKVKQHHCVERSPIEMAVRSMEKKSQEMAQLAQTFSSHGEEQSVASLNSLTMALNGVIDAEVNGGIRMYREAFLLPSVRGGLSLEDQAWIPRLERAIQENVRVVGVALDVHRLRCPSNLQQLQDKLDRTSTSPSLSLFPDLCYILSTYSIIRILSRENVGYSRFCRMIDLTLSPMIHSFLSSSILRFE